VFPWFSVQHNACPFAVSESVRTVGAHRTEGLRVFPWFSVQHNACPFAVSKSVRTVGAHRTEGLRKKNRMDLSSQHLLVL
jgi:hypothetical protein